MNINSANTNNKSQQSKNSLLSSTKAALLAKATAGAIQLSGSVVAANAAKKENSGLTGVQKGLIESASKKILNNTGLDKKGVSILDPEGLITPLDMIEDNIEEGKIKNIIKKFVSYFEPISSAQAGNNCFYCGQDFRNNEILRNKILINMDKMPYFLFHEIGHAHNDHFSKILKSIQKNRGQIQALATIITLFSAFTKKAQPKEENNNELTKGQKAKNFIRNNSGKLAFIAMLPILLEEGIATLKGNKFAKEFLSSDMAKKVRKANAKGFVSYLAFAFANGFGAYIAKKVKDDSTEKKQIKLYSHQG